MSAPSKEEIAAQVAWARSRIGRYPEPPHAAVIVAIADENERLRAENEKLMADALVRQTTEITLRAELDGRNAQVTDIIAVAAKERAECLELLENLDLGSEEVDRACLPNEDGSCGWLPEYGTCVEHKRLAMVAKLRGTP